MNLFFDLFACCIRGKVLVLEKSRAFIELVQGGRGGVEREGRGSESQGEINDEKSLRFSEGRDPANRPVSHPWKTPRTQNHPQILLKSPFINK